MDGPDFPAPPAPARGRAARRGPAARLRRADPRAQHQAVVWWAGSWDSRNSALGRLLFARDADGNVPADGRRDADRRRGDRALRGARAPTRPGASASSARRSGCRRAWAGDADGAGGAARGRAFDRDLDWRWRRTSYSDITAGALRGAGGERARGARRRRRGAAARRRRPPAPDDGDGRRCCAACRRCWRRCRSASHVGTLRAPRVRGDRLRRARPRRRARRRTSRRPRRAGASTSATRRRVVAGLRAAIETPLGPLLGGRALRDIARADRLDELDFELPLVGGDEPDRAPDARRDRRACCATTSPTSDPLAGYAERLDDPSLRQSVRGYLTGSIDLVVRLPATASRSSTTRRTGSRAPGRGADRLAPPPGRARRPRCSTRTTRCRRCSTPSRCTATCAGGCPATTPSATSPASSTCSCAGWSGRDTPAVDGTPVRRLRLAAAGALVVALSDVLDRGDGA